MVHVEYNVPLVLISVIVAILASYAAIVIQQLVFQDKHKRFEKAIIFVSGLALGVAIWLMHFIGILACHLPKGYHFEIGYTVVSYIIAASASIFAIWLNSRPTLPVSRLVIGSVLMGLGIAGMHYTGMMGLVIPDHKIFYDPLMVILSILIAIAGSCIAFFLAFKYKSATRYKFLFRVAIACTMGFSIVGMHYIGMAGAFFNPLTTETVFGFYQNNSSLLLFTVIVVTILILIVGLFVAALELRLEEKNQVVQRLNLELSALIEQDHLTKLPNRIFLEDYAKTILTQHRMQQKQIAFLYIDLDRFKVINDVFGHRIGDQLLIEVVRRVQSVLHQQAKLVRLGGDEFLLIIEETQLEDAIQISEQIIGLVKKEYKVTDKEISLSASIGISMFPEHGDNFKDLLINADMAMFLAKENGRNTYRVFNNSLEANKAKSEFQLANDLHRAIEEKQFFVCYQPKFNINREICGVETLIRWQHPTLGLIGPQMFIDIAERTGLIIPMGYWVLQQACKQIRQWEQSGLPFYPIAVNLSTLQFEHNTLFLNLESLLEKYQINPHHLIIEVTETTAMRNVELCVESFQKLRQMGIQIAIDDFGTGYSSFSYLKDLPLDELKIDKVFIVNLTENSKEETILASIIQLATKLGLTVTAEGVETQEQADILIKLGCHQLQGYLFAKPMPLEELNRYKSQLAQ